MIELGSFRHTAHLAVTAGVAIYTSPGPQSIYVIVADRTIRLGRNTLMADDEAAFILNEGEHARLRLEKNETLSFCLVEGETDGTVRLTEAT